MTLKRTSLVILGLSIVLICYGLIPIPKPLFKQDYSTVLFDEKGALLSASIAEDEQWRFPKSDSIPEKYKKALILFEDEYFQYHLGINPFSIIKSAYTNFKQKRIIRGGSTLSMQTIRMAFGNQKRTYKQKFLEILSSLKLELHYSKNEILNLYASHAPFGGNIVGLNAASWFYFQRSPQELSWSEAASLAVLPNNPSYAYPGGNREVFKTNRDRLLDKLLDRKIIDSVECILSKQEPLPHPAQNLPNLAYHLLHTAKAQGFEGQNIQSSIRLELQEKVNDRLEQYAQSLKHNQIHNAAAIIVDIPSGKVLAYKGNVSTGNEHSPFVDIIQAKRSPGSLLKPFLYAACIDEGIIYPRQLLPDIPMYYRGFAPKNFDKKFRGAVPADQALAGSLNVPFVHLLRDYGYEKFHWKMKQMGMKSLDRTANHYGLSLILGGAETSLWEITSLFAGLVRTYDNFPERPINKGYSNSDFTMHSFLAQQKKAEQELNDKGLLSYEAISYTLKSLQSLKRPEEEYGWEQFEGDKQIAWKTGTSFGFKDAWAIGFSNNHLVGVWVGNADGEGRPGLVGVKAAAPIMFNLFDLLPGNSNFDISYGTEIETCEQSGMKAGLNCEETVPLLISDKLKDSPLCAFHKIIFLDEKEQYRVTADCYPLDKMARKNWFVLPPVQARFYKTYNPNYVLLPEFKAGCSASNAFRPMAMIYPMNNSKIFIPLEQDGKKGKAIFELSHLNPNTSVYWHLDGSYLGQTMNGHKMAINASKGKHRLHLIDEMGNEVSLNFEVLN